MKRKRLSAQKQMKTMLFAMTITLLCITIFFGLGLVELSTEEVTLPNPNPSFTYGVHNKKLEVTLINSQLKANIAPIAYLHQLRLQYYTCLTPRWLKNIEAGYLVYDYIEQKISAYTLEKEWAENCE